MTMPRKHHSDTRPEGGPGMVKVTSEQLDAALGSAGSVPGAVPLHNSDDEKAEIAVIKKRLITEAGGAVDPETACARLGGISPDALEERRGRLEVLAVTLEGRTLYPMFQFLEGQIMPHLREVLQAFEGASSWTMLGVLLDPSDALSGATPVDELLSGRYKDAMEVAAGWGNTGGA